MDDYSIIGKIVRFHRKKAGLTQIELANLAEIGKTVVFDIENGKLSIQFTSLLKVLHILNIKLDFKSPLIKAFKEQEHEES